MTQSILHTQTRACIILCMQGLTVLLRLTCGRRESHSQLGPLALPRIRIARTPQLYCMGGLRPLPITVFCCYVLFCTLQPSAQTMHTAPCANRRLPPRLEPAGGVLASCLAHFRVCLVLEVPTVWKRCLDTAAAEQAASESGSTY